MIDSSQAFTASDSQHMRRAIALSRNALGFASPNPAVGCVVVKANEIIGQGCTQAFGGPHAEAVALKDVGEAARGATLYVSLMPCAHHGKTPPCTDAIISAGIARVVVALDDPDPVSGKGKEVLEKAGVKVEIGLLAEEALEVLAGFIKFVKTGIPLLRLKYAMTLDGKLATRTGSSEWISSEESRAEVQVLRCESDALMVGAGTVQADNPLLTVRDSKQWQPARVIVDSKCSTSPEAKIFQEGKGKVIVLVTDSAPEASCRAWEEQGAEIILLPEDNGGVDLPEALRALGAIGIRNILCEGGSRLAGSLFDAGLIDEVITYVAPKLCGGAEALTPIGGEGIPKMPDARKLTHVTMDTIGGDLRIRGRVGEWEWAEI
ncbi:MAG: bifunctional diaminohydroxyphosphoribosylaminopyrimidine deaminase/5-amino-6-(5-phosphoribosylamino)uracil reductase RibD [Planctomycetes bacterium]|nr:bifunctional diaminohydroxyphosphoribosylaminopyrimidine deaminase/5-amino-6-(5-phosphoribosylamino)uracil reductase RibD [Planctomycetota bacterium]